MLKKLAIIAVLSLALAIIILDSAVLNVSFSYTLRDLKTDNKSLQWLGYDKASTKAKAIAKETA